jgi:hypothetical protein
LHFSTLLRVSALAAAVVIFMTALATSQIEQFNPPKQYYLALGESDHGDLVGQRRQSVRRLVC